MRLLVGLFMYFAEGYIFTSGVHSSLEYGARVPYIVIMRPDVHLAS